MMDTEKATRLRGARHDRGGADRLHARPHAQRRVRHPRRGAEHHVRADEDVPDAARLRVEGRGHRRHHADRPAERRRLGAGGGAARSSRTSRASASSTSTTRDVVRHKLVQQIVKAYDALRRSAAQRDDGRPAPPVEVVGRRRGAARRRSPLVARRVAPARARGALTWRVAPDRRVRGSTGSIRGKDTATDVLSFPGWTSRACWATSSIAPRASPRRQARAGRPALRTELRVLALHGLLHLLGYDHERDGGRMAPARARLRRKGGLREGLIERDHRPAHRATPDDAARAVSRRLRHGLSRHRAGRVQRADAALAAADGRARRPQRSAGALSRRSALLFIPVRILIGAVHRAGRRAHRAARATSQSVRSVTVFIVSFVAFVVVCEHLLPMADRPARSGGSARRAAAGVHAARRPAHAGDHRR